MLQNKVCQICSEEVQYRFPSERSRRFCSSACYKSWRNRPQIERICSKCEILKQPKDFNRRDKVCRSCRAVVQITRYASNPKYKDMARERARRIKNRVIHLLGGCCACCGETLRAFLTLDHVGGGGNIHRKQWEGRGSNLCVYEDVLRMGCPKDKFRVLCWNCNAATAFYGSCPHDEHTFSIEGMAC